MPDDGNNAATEYNFNVKSSGSSVFGVLGNGAVLLGNSYCSPFVASQDHHATSKKYVDDAVAGVQADVNQNESDAVAAIALKANTASPTFTGTPAAPTAGAGTNTTQLATTAFVTTAVANVLDSATRRS